MKIISAGFPKTGTKSASRALRLVKFTCFIEVFMTREVTAVLFESTRPRNHFNFFFRILGYNVCDVLESAQFGIVKNWLDFMNGERPIEDVLEAYQKHGFG